MSPIAPLPAGSRLSSYEIVAVLGRGGSAIVYDAIDANLGRPVAIKELLPESGAQRVAGSQALDGAAPDAAARAAFVEKARVQARLAHPNVVAVFAFFEANGTVYQVMERIDGGSLQTLLASRPSGLAASQVRRILSDVADGLSALHRAQWLHRDIKPANILLRRSSGQAVIADLGAARHGRDATVAGLTPGYAALEQFASGPEGPWTDIYGLGALGYALLLGAPPPSAPQRRRDDIRQALRPRLFDGELFDAIDQALKLDFRERPANVEAWRSLLEPSFPAIVGAPLPPPVASVPPPLPDSSVMRPRPAGWLGFLSRIFGSTRRQPPPSGPGGGPPTLDRIDPADRLAEPSFGPGSANKGSILDDLNSPLPPLASSHPPPAMSQGPPTMSGPRDSIATSKSHGDLAAPGAIHTPFGAPATSALTGDTVASVFAPDRVAVGDTAMVQVFLHLHEQTGMASAAALAFDDTAQQRGARTLSASIPPGTPVQVTLTMSGLMVEPAIDTIVWNRRPESAQFSVEVPASHRGGGVIGIVRVLLGGAPIGELRFKMALIAGAPPDVTRGPALVDARRYRRAFVSYAGSDRGEVLRRVQMLRRVGVEVFQDVLDLEPGQRWERELYRRIDECDVMLLFWSRAARDSEWVAREVDYALARQVRERTSEDAPDMPAIEPLPIEGPPIPEPPERLKHLHFNDALLYAIAGEDRVRTP